MKMLGESPEEIKKMMQPYQEQIDKLSAAGLSRPTGAISTPESPTEIRVKPWQYNSPDEVDEAVADGTLKPGDKATVRVDGKTYEITIR